MNAKILALLGALTVSLHLTPAAQAAPPSFQLYPGVSASVDALDYEGDRSARLQRVAALGGAQLGLQYAALLALQPPNWKDHGNSLTPSWGKFSANFSTAPAWDPQGMGGGGALGYLQADGDSWVTNVVGHGLQGSEVHLRMRQEGFGVWESLMAGALHSTVWEYGIEGWNETPSLWDLLYTPIGGMLIGELRHLLVETLRDLPGETAFETGALFIVDPVSFVF